MRYLKFSILVLAMFAMLGGKWTTTPSADPSFGISGDVGNEATLNALLNMVDVPLWAPGPRYYFSDATVGGGDFPAGNDSNTCLSPTKPCLTWTRADSICEGANCIFDAGESFEYDTGEDFTTDWDYTTNRVAMTMRSSRPGVPFYVTYGTGSANAGVFHIDSSDAPGTGQPYVLVLQDMHWKDWASASSRSAMAFDGDVITIQNRVGCPDFVPTGSGQCWELPGGRNVIINPIANMSENVAANPTQIMAINEATHTTILGGVLQVDVDDAPNNNGNKLILLGDAANTDTFLLSLIGTILRADDSSTTSNIKLISGNEFSGLQTVRLARVSFQNATGINNNGGCLDLLMDSGHQQDFEIYQSTFENCSQAIQFTGADADADNRLVMKYNIFEPSATTTDEVIRATADVFSLGTFIAEQNIVNEQGQDLAGLFTYLGGGGSVTDATVADFRTAVALESDPLKSNLDRFFTVADTTAVTTSQFASTCSTPAVANMGICKCQQNQACFQAMAGATYLAEVDIPAVLVNAMFGVDTDIHWIELGTEYSDYGAR